MLFFRPCRLLCPIKGFLGHIGLQAFFSPSLRTWYVPSTGKTNEEMQRAQEYDSFACVCEVKSTKRIRSEFKEPIYAGMLGTLKGQMSLLHVASIMSWRRLGGIPPKYRPKFLRWCFVSRHPNRPSGRENKMIFIELGCRGIYISCSLKHFNIDKPSIPAQVPWAKVIEMPIFPDRKRDCFFCFRFQSVVSYRVI